MRRILSALGALGLGALGGALACASALAQPAADTLGAVRARGVLACGVAPSDPGFSIPDSRGVWRGLDVDTCRAVAAAVLGDAEKVRFVPSSTQQRFTMLQSGEVDLLARNTTWTLGREAQLGLAFAGINFYDGQGFLVRRDLGVASARELDGATVCVHPGTTTEQNLSDWFRSHRLRFSPVLIESTEELRGAFLAGRCDAFTGDTSTLAAFRTAQGPDAGRFAILPEVISKEPLGPAVRQGDWRWFHIVRWVQFAMIAAEEIGIARGTIDQFASSQNPDVQRLLGRSGELGAALGLENDWVARVVAQVGNFGEVWERNITPMGVPRGVNDLWTRGGLHYAPPLR
jgi:general L-amino acid transport system substrate-binding protein